MCLDCDEVCCKFCGVPCRGTCDDPDYCPSCWVQQYLGEWFGDEELEDCYRGGCNCDCHGDWFNHHLRPIIYHAPKNQTPFVRKGVFPFLKLAGELREKIYHLVLQQTGKDRTSASFVGTVDTAILSTCRQINKEARHIPLTTTKLSFLGPFQALHFLGMQLAPNQRHLVKALHFQLKGWTQLIGLPLKHLVAELGKIPLKHLSVTIIGAIDKDAFKENSTIEQRLLQIKGLESFTILIGSGTISEKVKKEIIEGMQRRMIARGTLGMKKTLKRIASKAFEEMFTERAAKAAKALSNVSSSAHEAHKTLAPMLHDRAANIPATRMKQIVEKALELNKRYATLVEYAHTFDYAASSVCIRLKQAQQAVDDIDEEIFEKLALSIVRTLEEQAAKIMKARNKVLFPEGVPTQ